MPVDPVREPGPLDLRLPPRAGLPVGLVIPGAELTERFTRSSGPGGQGVNTTDSRVQLSLDVVACAAFTDDQRDRLLDRLGAVLVDGVLTVAASSSRHQRRNRQAAREVMAATLSDALAPPPPPRRPTRPSRAARARRLPE